MLWRVAGRVFNDMEARLGLRPHHNPMCRGILARIGGSALPMGLKKALTGIWDIPYSVNM